MEEIEAWMALASAEMATSEPKTTKGKQAQAMDHKSGAVKKTELERLIRRSHVPIETEEEFNEVANAVTILWADLDATIHRTQRTITNKRILIGQKLQVLQNYILEGNRYGGWGVWCKENYPTRSLRDIQRLLKLAGAEDPVAAHEAEKQAQRDAYRENVAKPLEATLCRFDGNCNEEPSGNTDEPGSARTIAHSKRTNGQDDERLILERMKAALSLQCLRSLLTVSHIQLVPRIVQRFQPKAVMGLNREKTRV
jgi:hypothetical protein